MADFKVVAVSDQVREFQTKFGNMKSYKLKLEGVEEVVELAQKDTTPAPTAGQTLTGSIDMTGQYGPKFKKENPNYGGGGGSFGGSSGSKPGYTPKDEKAIQAMWAIGQAVAALGQKTEDQYPEHVEALAIKLFNMVDVVKTGVAATEEVVVAEGDNLADEVMAIMSEPVKPSDIPF